MTSIGSVSSYKPPSPLELLQNELSSEVSSGTVKSSDESALSSALDDIDSALKSEGSSTFGPPSPKDIQSKVNDLISTEVKNGKLTSNQADQLKNIFAKALPQGDPGGPGGHGGPHGPGNVGTTNSASGDQSSTSDASSSSTDTNSLLQDFLKLIQDAQNTNGYSASGDTQKAFSSMLVSFNA